MNLTEIEVMELQRRASARTGRADSARHARLILLLAEGLTWAEVRAKLDCSDSYVDRWSKRFAADRLAGLFTRHAGRERYKVTDRIEARVLQAVPRTAESLRGASTAEGAERKQRAYDQAAIPADRRPVRVALDPLNRGQRFE